MYFINDLKYIINNDIIIIFLVISYILIFNTSKELKRSNYHRDYKIVKTTGILYGILALAAAAAIYM
ncbi:MAG: CLC_0170 family protein [Sedimentibacter sp.]